MAQRLLRIVVPASDRDRLLEILADHGRRVDWVETGERDDLAVEAVIPAEGMEPMLDELEQAFQGRDPFRLVLLPVKAAIPRPKEEQPDSGDDGDDDGDADGEGEGDDVDVQAPPEPEKGDGGDAEEEDEPSGPARISREELYSSLTDISGLDPYYISMVALSAVVASVGILRDNPAILVGAMVIAPLLGPNMALALATTLGDVDLGKEAVGSTSLGVAVALAVAAVWGLVANVDPGSPGFVRLTTVGYGELFLALAAGSAGVLSITRGTATALVGVMVAVALLPPLVAVGLLLGAGELALALDATILVAANVICVNLAGVVTFLIQGVRPRRWWEADRARKATRIAILLWVLLLVGLVLVIGRARGG